MKSLKYFWDRFYGKAQVLYRGLCYSNQRKEVRKDEKRKSLWEKNKDLDLGTFALPVLYECDSPCKAKYTV